MKWDRYQATVLDEVANGSGHLVVQARAGSGKTTVIIEAVNQLGRRGDSLLCAFNKEIQLDLERRAPHGCTVKTLHSLGMGVLGKHWGRKFDIDKSKSRRIVWRVLKSMQRRRNAARGFTEDMNTYAQRLLTLVGLSKNTLVGSREDIAKLAHRHGLLDKNVPEALMTNMVVDCLTIATDFAVNGELNYDGTRGKRIIDFDDMLYLPAKLNLDADPFDFVFVDETQDLNAAQLDLIKKHVRANGRIIAVGDPRQAIYSWRGADKHAMPSMLADLSAKTLPLSVTYRCPTKVVEYVNRMVPDLEARPDAPEGQVQRVGWKSMFNMFTGIRRGDFVLSRTNAPLAGVCLRLLRSHIPAVIAGKDIGRGLIDFVERSRTNSVAELHLYMTKHIETLSEDFKNTTDEVAREAKAEFILDQLDQVDAVRAVAEGETMVVAVLATLNMLFTDDAAAINQEDVVVCSTVHKAKGKERDRVWVLQGTFFNKLGDQEEESNLYYVACTRAKSELFLVRNLTADDAIDAIAEDDDAL